MSGLWTLDPVYVDEDVEIVVSIPGGSIAGWTFTFRLWRPDGTEVTGAGVTVAITDAPAGVVTARVVGLTLAPGVHRWTVRRVDAGSRTVAVSGDLVVYDERR